MNGLTTFDKREVAAWLRDGIAINKPRTTENRVHWLYRNKSGFYEACALGFALVGKVGDVDLAYAVYEATLSGRSSFHSHRDTMIKLTGIQPDLLDMIHGAHYHHGLSAITIAERLEGASL